MSESTKMTKELIQLIESFEVSPKWVNAIILQESSWKNYALRFEPNYPYLFQVDQFAKKLVITSATETTCQKMSWGLGQIMGALAREQGHDGPMGQLFKPKYNILHMCKRIQTLKKISPRMDDIFAMYNGGPGALIKKKDGIFKNQVYVDSVKKKLNIV